MFKSQADHFRTFRYSGFFLEFACIFVLYELHFFKRFFFLYLNCTFLFSVVSSFWYKVRIWKLSLMNIFCACLDLSDMTIYVFFYFKCLRATYMNVCDSGWIVKLQTIVQSLIYVDIFMTNSLQVLLWQWLLNIYSAYIIYQKRVSYLTPYKLCFLSFWTNFSALVWQLWPIYLEIQYFQKTYCCISRYVFEWFKILACLKILLQSLAEKNLYIAACMKIKFNVLIVVLQNGRSVFNCTMNDQRCLVV